jgi:NADPH:quinone reductase-like Zn-dependent oxidoreductase
MPAAKRQPLSTNSAATGRSQLPVAECSKPSSSGPAPSLGDGAFGEYVTAPVAYAARVPAGLDLAVAGALGLAGTAALAAVDAVDPLPGQTVLISGDTGGVGAFAVQLAAASGAYVISTARPGEDDDAFLRDLGAHATVDYTGDVPAAVTALRPAVIHAVVHLAGDGLELADLLIPGGRIASTVGLPPDQLGGRAVQATTVMAVPDRRTLERLAADVVNGQLAVPVQRTYPLADVPRALADFAAGTRGKLAISVA